MNNRNSSAWRAGLLNSTTPLGIDAKYILSSCSEAGSASGLMLPVPGPPFCLPIRHWRDQALSGGADAGVFASDRGHYPVQF